MLANLRTLSLAGNRLEVMPAELGNLTALEDLGLPGNLLQELPESLGKLKVTVGGGDISVLVFRDCNAAVTFSLQKPVLRTQQRAAAPLRRWQGRLNMMHSVVYQGIYQSSARLGLRFSKSSSRRKDAHLEKLTNNPLFALPNAAESTEAVASRQPPSTATRLAGGPSCTRRALAHGATPLLISTAKSFSL